MHMTQVCVEECPTKHFSFLSSYDKNDYICKYHVIPDHSVLVSRQLCVWRGCTSIYKHTEHSMIRTMHRVQAYVVLVLNAVSRSESAELNMNSIPLSSFAYYWAYNVIIRYVIFVTIRQRLNKKKFPDEGANMAPRKSHKQFSWFTLLCPHDHEVIVAIFEKWLVEV